MSEAPARHRLLPCHLAGFAFALGGVALTSKR
jgi:hypothetical protein